MTQVFVSYKQSQRERVRPIVDALLHRGLTVWWDDALEVGEDFSRRINHELDRATVVLVAWSAAAVESDFIRGEADRARALRKLVPIQLEPCVIPVPFNAQQTINFEGWNGRNDDERIEDLVRSIFGLVNEQDPEWIPASIYQALGAEAHWGSPTSLSTAMRHGRAMVVSPVVV